MRPAALATRLRAHDGLPYYERRSILGERLAGRQVPQRQVPASLESARRLLSDTLAYHREVHFTERVHAQGGRRDHVLRPRSPRAASRPEDLGVRRRAAAGSALPRRPAESVLREIARRRVGPEVAFRKKQGFTVPVERWLADRWSGMLDRLGEDTILERDGWVRRGSLRAPLREALAARWVPVQLWRLLVLEHWLEKNGSGAIGPPSESWGRGMAGQAHGHASP